MVKASSVIVRGNTIGIPTCTSSVYENGKLDGDLGSKYAGTRRLQAHVSTLLQNSPTIHIFTRHCVGICDTASRTVRFSCSVLGPDSRVKSNNIEIPSMKVPNLSLASPYVLIIARSQFGYVQPAEDGGIHSQMQGFSRITLLISESCT